MEVKTRYITLEEFNSFWATNLEEDTGGRENALALINRVELRLESYISSHFNRNVPVEFAHFSDYQKGQYKYALLYQVEYVFRNGELDTDSGTDVDKGTIVKDSYLNEISICRATKDALRDCGLWNRNLSSRGKYGGRFIPF